MNRNRKILTGLATAALVYPALTGSVQAAYHADSDTGIDALDYIEQEHRTARERRLTPEQEKLLQDAAQMEKNLRRPLDPSKPAPVAFEGDDLTYDERDGSFIAKGKVDILQMDAHRFQGEEITGNVQRQEIHIPDKAHVLQLTPGQVRVTLDGYRANYNYGAKTGTMEDVRGKADAHYITARRFEFYPDHIVAYDGTETKCGAKKPDYHRSAKKIILYPNQKIIMEHVKFWLKGTVLFSRKHYESNLSGADGHETNYPRVGYNTDDGAYLKWHLTFPVRGKLDTHANILINTKDGWRSNYDLTWSGRNMSTGLTYGYFEDGDDKWIKKEPSYFWQYGSHIGRTHLTYSLNAEYGRWYGNGVHSNHGSYGAGLGYDPIRFHRNTLYLHTGYDITRESYDDSRVAGMSADIVLTRDFDDRWAAYAGYHYSKKNEENSLFSFDTDDYSKKAEGGFSYRIDAINRVAVGTRYDLDHSKWRNIDYYWYHDLHCSQIILRYKSKENHVSLRWQFTPW